MHFQTGSKTGQIIRRAFALPRESCFTPEPMNSANNRTPLAWWKAVGLSVAGLYVPFVAMATYTSLFVSCPHCKKTVWQILPFAPGFMPGWLGLQWITHSATELSLWITTGIIVILMLMGLSFMMRRGGRWRVTTMATMLIVVSLLAVMTLAIIRA